jgi:hypothetical protein
MVSASQWTAIVSVTKACCRWSVTSNSADPSDVASTLRISNTPCVWMAWVLACANSRAWLSYQARVDCRPRTVTRYGVFARMPSPASNVLEMASVPASPSPCVVVIPMDRAPAYTLSVAPVVMVPPAIVSVKTQPAASAAAWLAYSNPSVMSAAGVATSPSASMTRRV